MVGEHIKKFLHDEIILIQSKIDKLKQHAHHAEQSIKKKLEPEITDWEVRLKTLKQNISELSAHSLEAAQDMKKGIDKALSDMKKALDQALNRFN